MLLGTGKKVNLKEYCERVTKMGGTIIVIDPKKEFQIIGKEKYNENISFNH